MTFQSKTLMKRMLILLIPALATALVLSHLEFYGRYRCHNYQKITGVSTKWVLFDSCYIEVEDQWFRWDEYLYQEKINLRKGMGYEGQLD